MKKVYMTATLRAPAGVVLRDEDVTHMSFGGYIFMVDGKEIPFDFEGSAAEIFLDENGYGIKMQTQHHGFFKHTDIDYAVFSGVYEKIGIRPQNITAAFLASATAITEFRFTICMNGADAESEATQSFSDSFIVENIRFMDENGKAYDVDKSILNRTIAQITNA